MQTYFLSSLESKTFSLTRKCDFLSQSSFSSNKPYIVAKISPPVIGQPFNKSEDIDTILLATRHQGENIINISEFPCFVFIAIPKNDTYSFSNISEKNDLDIIGWGELYRTKHDADHHIFD